MKEGTPNPGLALPRKTLAGQFLHQSQQFRPALLPVGDYACLQAQVRGCAPQVHQTDRGSDRGM